MWFHFFIGNHNKTGRASLYDMMEWLTAGLTELKHDVTVGHTIAPHAVNIVWENFRHEDEDIFKSHDFKFGLIATEIPVGRTFNWLEDGAWPTRRRTFDKIARTAQFIWSMVEEPVGDYERWAPSGYLELGFSERIVDPIFAREPQVDFGFYGLNITPYRNTVLDHLRKYCTIATPNRFLKGHDLNSFIASFKVGICLKHSPQWTIPSPARTARLLHAKRGIATEYVPVRTRASAFAAMADKNQDFAAFCIECLRGPWKQRAEEAYARFRAAMPMKQIMERLLDMTVAKSSTSSGSTVLSASDDGLRDRVRFRASYQPIGSPFQPRLLEEGYRGHNLVQFGRRYWGLPQSLGSMNLNLEEHRRRPGVLQSERLSELKALINAENGTQGERNGPVVEPEKPFEHRLLEEGYNGYNLVQFGPRFWGLPQALGPTNLNLEVDRRRQGVLQVKSLVELKALIDKSTKGSAKDETVAPHGLVAQISSSPTFG